MTLLYLRNFLDRMDVIATNAFFRTKDALDQIEGNTYTTAQAILNPLLTLDDILAAFAPGPSNYIYPPIVMITGSHTSNAAVTGTVQLTPAASQPATSKALQPYGNISAPAIPAANISANVANTGILTVTISNVATIPGIVAGSYRGPVMGTNSPLALVYLQLT